MGFVSDGEESRRLGIRLREARERLGLTTRGLSRLVHIPPATISALERGREPRWSTLMRYLENVPGLRADRLLPAPEPHPPAASGSLWDHLRRVFAQGARSASVTLRRGRGGTWRLETVVEGLHADSVHETRAETARRLMQLACNAPVDLVSRLRPPEPGRRRVRVADGAVVHEFDVTPSGALRVRYRRVETLAAEPPSRVEFAASFALGRLTLAAEIPRDRRACLLAWPVTRRPEGAVAEIAAHLYPTTKRPRLRRRGALVTVTIPEVIPGLDHVLDWSEASAASDAGLELEDDPAEEGFAPLAIALRKRSGLSQRALAEAMGVSHVTVAEAEKGRDPSASTLRRYLEAVPGVASQAILPATEARGPLTPLEAWEALRDLHAIEVELITQVSTIHADGRREFAESYEGVRAVGPARRVLLATMQGRNIYARGRMEFRTIEVDVPGDDGEEAAEEVTTRFLRTGQGRPVQHVVIPAGVAARGLALRQAGDVTGYRHLLSRADVHARYGPTDEIVVQGVGRTVWIPVRRLRYALRFMGSFRPLAIWPVALPADMQYDEVPLGVLNLAHPGAWTWTSSPGGEHVLEVSLPLYGLKYGIGWSI